MVMSRRGEEGFTLVELMVTIVIIGVLVGIALPSLLRQREQAMDLQATSRLDTAGRAAAAIFVETGAHSDQAAMLGFFTPDVDFSSGADDSVHVVVDSGDATRVLLYSRSDSGDWFGLRLEGLAESTCVGDAETDMTLDACTGSEW
jgi:type IV pilus assembly protein PilA